MAKRKIAWTEKANSERKEILSYWIERNKSKTFSAKLNLLFIEAINQIAEYPTIGRQTDLKNVRVKIVREYLVFYQFDSQFIAILSIWDNRRNEKEFNLK
jgi:toxin YoeB